MAKRKGSPVNDDWRQLEQLVTRIERTLAPDAQVKHNDSVWDYESEGRRQVDVTIRYKLGATPILITVECRKRGKKSDVNWIEELAQKRLDIHADKTIAVASKPLTTPPLRKAKKKNILFRLMSEVSSEEIKTWAIPPTMVYEERTIKLLDMRAEFVDDGPEENETHDDVNRALDEDLDHAKVFVKGDTSYSATDFINSWVAAFGDGHEGDLFKDVPSDGAPFRRAIRLTFPGVEILTTGGMRVVSTLILRLEMRITKTHVVASKTFGLSADGDIIAQGIQFSTNEQFPATITFMKSDSVHSVAVEPTHEAAKKIGRKLEDLPDFVMRIPPERSDSGEDYSNSW